VNPGARSPIVTLPTLQARGAPLASPAEQARVLDALPLAGGEFDERLAESGLHPLTALGIDVLQVNVGKLCNQTCHHCHVDAGPTRTEQMSVATAELALRVLGASAIPTLDITGGAPELSPVFRRLVEGARAHGRRVIDRCNLTILMLPRFEDLPDFLARNEVEIVASLPHYRRGSTDRQRGEGVFERSIEALRKLNAVGYGRGGKLRLVLVTNPVGAFLPGASQATLEAEWKREMRRLHGVEFDALFTITNMPIARYLDWLEQSGNLAAYMEKLAGAYNPAAAAGVMCRTTLSVGWDGRLYDCDFNAMLELETGFGAPRELADFDFDALATRRIVTRRHCFGCTAGAGSSCGGQTVG